MRRPHAVIVGAVTLLAVAAALIALSTRLVEVTNAGEPAPGIIFHIDCNTTLAGIQDQCTYPTGTTQVDVDVVVENNTGAAFDLGGFGFKLINNQRQLFSPNTPSCDASGIDCNPNFNQSDLSTAGWVCSPPTPDADTNADGDPTTSQSFLECFNAGPPPTGTLAAGGLLKLATTRFNVTGDVTSSLSLIDASMFDQNFTELGTCPTTEVPASCNAASVVIGTGATATHTPTVTPTPTTPEPQTTPSGTPTGAVDDVVALNESICVMGGSFEIGDAIRAIYGCQGAPEQAAFQQFLECLHHRPFCTDSLESSQIYQQADPKDLAIIDRDRDQVHAGQTLIVAAFVDGDYPVLFESDQGQFRGPNGAQVGQQLLCYSAIADALAHGDPDCDANEATLGDGVVIARLFITSDVPRGTFDVRVTQGLVSSTIPITVVGIPASIVVDSLDDKTSIATGAKPRTLAGMALDSDACDFIVDPPFTGAASSRKTNLLVKVLDDEGTEVVGSLVAWTRDGNPNGDHALFGQPGMEAGGASIPQIPTWDLGALGVGFVQTICGGSTAGTISSILKFVRVLDFNAPEEYALPYSIESTATPPPPTPTPTPCTDDEDCDGIPDATDNCGVYIYSVPIGGGFEQNVRIGPIPNPDQANNDRNFIDNSPPYAPVADDRTRADSDVYGDACDTDDDNDGLFDIDETGGPPCLAASGSTDPLKDDTDGDRFHDGAECAISTDPLDPSDKPPLSECGPPSELFFGMLSFRTSFCLYGLLPFDGDIDNDLATDGSDDFCEIVSLNADRIVNVADMGMLAFGIARSTTLANIDLNRDGAVNPADQGVLASIMSAHICPKTFNNPD